MFSAAVGSVSARSTSMVNDKKIAFSSLAGLKAALARPRLESSLK